MEVEKGGLWGWAKVISFHFSSPPPSPLTFFPLYLFVIPTHSAGSGNAGVGDR